MSFESKSIHEQLHILDDSVASFRLGETFYTRNVFIDLSVNENTQSIEDLKTEMSSINSSKQNNITNLSDLNTGSLDVTGDITTTGSIHITSTGGLGAAPKDVYVNDVPVGYTLTRKQNTLSVGDNISIDDNDVISSADTTYSAGDNVTILNNTISSVDTIYSAGENVKIINNVISSIVPGNANDVFIDQTADNDELTYYMPDTTERGNKTYYLSNESYRCDGFYSFSDWAMIGHRSRTELHSGSSESGVFTLLGGGFGCKNIVIENITFACSVMIDGTQGNILFRNCAFNRFLFAENNTNDITFIDCNFNIAGFNPIWNDEEEKYETDGSKIIIKDSVFGSGGGIRPYQYDDFLYVENVQFFSDDGPEWAVKTGFIIGGYLDTNENGDIYYPTRVVSYAAKFFATGEITEENQLVTKAYVDSVAPTQGDNISIDENNRISVDITDLACNKIIVTGEITEENQLVTKAYVDGGSSNSLSGGANIDINDGVISIKNDFRVQDGEDSNIRLGALLIGSKNFEVAGTRECFLGADGFYAYIYYKLRYSNQGHLNLQSWNQNIRFLTQGAERMYINSSTGDLHVNNDIVLKQAGSDRSLTELLTPRSRMSYYYSEESFNTIGNTNSFYYDGFSTLFNNLDITYTNQTNAAVPARSGWLIPAGTYKFNYNFIFDAGGLANRAGFHTYASFDGTPYGPSKGYGYARDRNTIDRANTQASFIKEFTATTYMQLTNKVSIGGNGYNSSWQYCQMKEGFSLEIQKLN